jgi:hypothetical protein
MYPPLSGRGDILINHTRSVLLMGIFVCAVGCIVAQGQTTTALAVTHSATRPASHPLDPAIELARASLQHSQSQISDYQALFIKRCRVDGVLPELQYAKIKVRNRKASDSKIVTPMSVYLEFLKPDEVKGREVIWVEGANDGKLIAHETGIKGLINVQLEPSGYIAMRGQRRPITDIGIENLIVKIIESAVRDRNHQECEVQFYRDARIQDRKCTMIQVVHPVPRDHFEFHRARVYFDDQLRIPIHYASWSWPTEPGGEAVIEEEYTYLNVETNVGLTNSDFDIANPAYRFQ